MAIIWMPEGVFKRSEYARESDLEAAIEQVKDALFGQGRIYLDVKKRIGPKSGRQNIPDGYLIDLRGRKPRLYVVENELASHDPLRHIAVQILQFSLSFDADPRLVRTVLFDAVHSNGSARIQCEEYARTHGFRNLDHLIDEMVFESPFAALVIIDEMPEKLETVLAERFRFGVEVLTLARYERQGEYLYHFEPFLADLEIAAETDEIASDRQPASIPPDELDTVVVPANREGFERTFLEKDCWYAVRIHGSMRPQIKYIAAYQTKPVSAITHIAPVKSVEPYRDSGKSIVYFSEPAQAISPIKLVRGGKVKSFQNLRYTSMARIDAATTLDDVFYE